MIYFWSGATAWAKIFNNFFSGSRKELIWICAVMHSHIKFQRNRTIRVGVIAILIRSIWAPSAMLDLTGSGFSQYSFVASRTNNASAYEIGQCIVELLTAWTNCPNFLEMGPNHIKFFGWQNRHQHSPVLDVRYVRCSLSKLGRLVCSEQWGQISQFLSLFHSL